MEMGVQAGMSGIAVAFVAVVADELDCRDKWANGRAAAQAATGNPAESERSSQSGLIQPLPVAGTMSIAVPSPSVLCPVSRAAVTRRSKASRSQAASGQIRASTDSGKPSPTHNRAGSGLKARGA
jgi:hypothetical protein